MHKWWIPGIIFPSPPGSLPSPGIPQQLLECKFLLCHLLEKLTVSSMGVIYKMYKGGLTFHASPLPTWPMQQSVDRISRILQYIQIEYSILLAGSLYALCLVSSKLIMHSVLDPLFCHLLNNMVMLTNVCCKWTFVHNCSLNWLYNVLMLSYPHTPTHCIKVAITISFCGRESDAITLVLKVIMIKQKQQRPLKRFWFYCVYNAMNNESIWCL